MRKVIKRIAMLFMVCGLAVSVSFGTEFSKSVEYNSEYQQKNKSGIGKEK